MIIRITFTNEYTTLFMQQSDGLFTTIVRNPVGQIIDILQGGTRTQVAVALAEFKRMGAKQETLYI